MVYKNTGVVSGYRIAQEQQPTARRALRPAGRRVLGGGAAFFTLFVCHGHFGGSGDRLAYNFIGGGDVDMDRHT